MKTTVDISDPLLDRRRATAVEDGDNPRTAVQKDSTTEPASRQSKATPFRMRQVTTGGNGLRAAVARLSMHDIILTSHDDSSK